MFMAFLTLEDERTRRPIEVHTTLAEGYGSASFEVHRTLLFCLTVPDSPVLMDLEGHIVRIPKGSIRRLVVRPA